MTLSLEPLWPYMALLQESFMSILALQGELFWSYIALPQEPFTTIMAL